MNAATIDVEIWKPVTGWEGSYEVSNLGRVRSLARQAAYERIDAYSGRVIAVTRKHAGKLLRPGRTSTGHMTVSLGRGNTQYVHVLVLTAFVGPCPYGMEGLHFDDVPANNRLGNLRWGTRSDNVKDAIRNGGFPLGVRHHMAKLTEQQVALIKAELPTKSTDRLALEHGVSGASIRQIKRGETWVHVGGDV